MHSLKKCDLSFLENSEITQIILVTKWSVAFVFTEGHQIVVEEAFSHFRVEDGRTYSYQLKEGLFGALYIQECLQHRITSAEGGDEALTLKIDNGDVLTVRIGRGPYESGQIITEGRYIVF
jgi:hypothetical protein